jgi:hypothetical protein
LGSGDWTGTSALTSDTARFFATQGATLYAVDPTTGAYGSLDTIDWTGAVAITAVATTKPQKTLLLPVAAVSGELVAALAGMRLQLDQTNDPSHEAALTARHPSCVPASPGEIAACRAQCLNSAGGDPNALKACEQNCSSLQDCTTVCGADSTYDYLTLGDTLKALAQKTCTSPDVSCPPCTVGDGNQKTSAVEDYDLTQWIPVPLFQTVVASDPFSCTLANFGFDTDASPPNFTFDTNDFHLDVAGFASSPTLNCNNGINPTVIDPHFLFDITPIVVNHHPTLSITTNFSGHLDYAFDWIDNLDNTLASQDSINSEFEAWLAEEIQVLTNGDQVDDYLDLTIDSTGITVVYTPLCVGGICSCTPDCSNKSCGTDLHCNSAVCGSCFAGQFCNDGAGACQCAPQCDGKSCGPDGCGGTCGNCDPGLTCLPGGTCCTPQCSGKSCGPDGCGGTCNPGCGPGDTCNASGQCVCVPRTSCGVACGVISDGCGGTLSCKPCTCSPSCTGKRCGAGDGCGGQCMGYCTKAGYACTDDGNGPYCARAP